MSWESELEELKRRRELRKAMGGPEGIARQRKRGKLTVRERIELFSDPDSFREFQRLAGGGEYEGNDLVGFTPSGSVTGIAKLDGRKVVVDAGDFTVRGGSGSGTRGGLGQELRPAERALEWRLPYVRLLDAAGGSVKGFEELGRTYLPDGNVWSQTDIELLSATPVVSAVMGSVAGLPAVNVCLAHFNVMVKDTGQVFPGGPPVVKAALGYDISKEDLGGWEIHTQQSGVVDNLALDEKDALAQIRRFLSYLPSNVWESAPRAECNDPLDRREECLGSLVPRNRRKAYNSHKAIDAVLDEGSFFEIAPGYGRARITGLGRINGHPVAIMANNTMFGASTDVTAGEKVIRLIQLANTFHLPMISLADEPGFMVGLESEKRGIERAGARLIAGVCRSTMPWITIVMGRLFGVAGQCQHRPSGMFQRYCWPSASWGSMHIQGGASAAYRREIDSAPDSEAKKLEIEERLNALASPFRTAEATGQDIIDPRDTRRLLVEFVDEAQSVLRTQLGPPAIPYTP